MQIKFESSLQAVSQILIEHIQNNSTQHLYSVVIIEVAIAIKTDLVLNLYESEFILSIDDKISEAKESKFSGSSLKHFLC